MRVLLDTNVVLDAMISTRPGATLASAIWQAASESMIDCFLTASSLTDIYYISRGLIRTHSIVDMDARQIVRLCLDDLFVIPVDRDDLERAYRLQGRDFEDDLQIACAVQHSLDAIITGDEGGGFAKSPIRILSPRQLMESLRPDVGPPTDPASPPQDTH